MKWPLTDCLDVLSTSSYLCMELLIYFPWTPSHTSFLNCLQVFLCSGILPPELGIFPSYSLITLDWYLESHLWQHYVLFHSRGKCGMDISIDCTSGPIIGDISGVRGGWSVSISELVSGVFIDSVKVPCAGEVGFSPTLSITCVRTCSKNASSPN